jgi:serine/threonine protein kinase
MTDRRSSLADFELLTRLGSGSFGVVYKSRRLIDNCIYVVKAVRISELSFKEQGEAINEVKLLAQMNSIHVVRYYDSFIEGTVYDNIYIHYADNRVFRAFKTIPCIL